MAQQIITTGNVAGDGTGDPLRDAFTKINENFTELYSGNVQVTAANILVYSVAGRTGNIVLTVNDVAQAASKSYVNTAIASNLANVTGSITNSLSANITAANTVISNHAARITTLESNSAAQASQINNLVSVKANVTYVDTSISLALSSNAILANVAAVNANVAAANAAILLRANLSGANFSGNIAANSISASNYIRTDSYFVGGSEVNQGQGQAWANPAALFFGNSAADPGPGGSRFYQINLQNLDPYGSSDIVATSDDGNDFSNFISMGISGSQFTAPIYPSQSPHDGYVYINGGNLDIQSEDGNVELMAGNLVTGQVVLTQSNILKLTSNLVIQFSDGTIQSTAFGGNINVSSLNANITAANAAITALQANAATQALDIDGLLNNASSQASSIVTLLANAASQGAALDSLSANLGAYQTFANSNASVQATSLVLLNANVTAANLNISSLLSNASVQALELNSLQSNAQSQQQNIIALQSNSVTQAVQIDSINSGLSLANTSISTLTANAASQSVQINSLNANLTAANLNIVALQSNAASQALDINNLYVNFGNVINLNANLSNITSNIETLQSNAIAQATQINLLNANVAAANINIQNSASLNGAIFSGNVQANYVLANANVKVGSTLEVGDISPIDYPGLGAVFVGNVDSYYQVVIQNKSNGTSASGDFVITADDGTDENKYLNIGMNNSNFVGNWTVPAGESRIPEAPYDGYFSVIGGNAVVRSDAGVFITANNAVAGLVKDGNFSLFTGNLTFRDGTIQRTAVTDVPGLLANVDVTINNVNDLNANVGAYQIFANANAAIQTTAIETIDANVGAYQTWANAGGFVANITSNFGSVNFGTNVVFSAETSTTFKQLFTIKPGDPSDNARFSFASNGNVIIDATSWTILRGTGAGNPIKFNIESWDANIGSLRTDTNTILSNVGNLSYTPANAANYTGTITNIQQALDELAERIKALGG